ncbi:MAG: lipase family protein [Treponema sp.]|nr:lipase family protein [Treponema sp.]
MAGFVFVSCASTKIELPDEDFTISDFQYSILNISPEEYDTNTANMSDEQKKFYTIKRTRDYKVIGEDLDYIVILNDEKKEIIIQYEESDSDEDWHNNYLFWPCPLKLDRRIVWTSYGYAKIYKSAQNAPIDEFCQLIQEHPDYKVVIWGWSLGSAMAKITARHFIIRTKGEVMIDELTTFGDVKCWYNPFYSSKKYCKKIREYVTPNDLITWCIPICRRDVSCRVGENFSFKKSKNSQDYHTHYEDYDYSKWE